LKMIITLLTDFGISDPYVGSMKGIMMGINPEIRIVDISHQVTRQNIDEAAYILKRIYPYFPEKTIHVIVVDPGVGSERHILVVKTNRQTFLAPDNGVLKYVFNEHPESQVYRVTNTEYFLNTVSRTFHGRDIFAPVAAHLSRGIPVSSLGDSFLEFVKGRIPRPTVGSKRVIGEIIYIDRFGNGITNIDKDLLMKQKRIKMAIRNQIIDKLYKTYSQVPTDKPLALIGSDETLEISTNGGNAKELIGFDIGDRVVVCFE
jgi:S-adenosylmethionine hydrolase